jgi:hypothetical protein
MRGAATTALGDRERPRLWITRSQQQTYVDPGANAAANASVKLLRRRGVTR